jgi:hypothetical protein
MDRFLTRTLTLAVVAYIAIAVFTKAQEARGVYVCGCDEDCWCKKPGLSLFRWVFPRFHRGRWDADSKELRELDG